MLLSRLDAKGAASTLPRAIINIFVNLKMLNYAKEISTYI